MKRLMRALLVEICPFKSFSYIERFFQTLYEINIANNRRLARSIHLIIWFELTMALREIVLGLVQWRPIDRIQFFDAIHLLGLSRQTNLMNSFLFIMVALVYQTIYLRLDRLCFSIINETIIKLNPSFFLSPFHRPGRNRSRVSICLFVRQSSMLTLNCLQVFVIVLDLFLLYLQYLLFQLVGDNWEYFFSPHQSWWWSGAKLVLAELNLLLYWSSFLLIVRVLIIWGSVFTCFTLIYFLKCSQVYHLLLRDIHLKLVTNRRSNRLSRFMRKHTTLLTDLSHINRSYSSLFLAYLLASLPFNIHVIGLLLVGNRQRELLHLFFIGALLIEQFLGVFLIHLICALYTRRIHRPTARLFYLDARFRFYSRRSQLKLAAHIERFHTRNRYGITYGKYGLITIEGFVKYLMIYAKQLMMSYKLLRMD